MPSMPSRLLISLHRLEHSCLTTCCHVRNPAVLRPLFCPSPVKGESLRGETWKGRTNERSLPDLPGQPSPSRHAGRTAARLSPAWIPDPQHHGKIKVIVLSQKKKKNPYLHSGCVHLGSALLCFLPEQYNQVVGVAVRDRRPGRCLLYGRRPQNI